MVAIFIEYKDLSIFLRYVHSLMHTHTNTHTHARMHTDTHTHTRARTHTCTHANNSGIIYVKLKQTYLAIILTKKHFVRMRLRVDSFTV